MSEADLHSAVRDGIELCYEAAGDGEPPIVFVHGWGCSHTAFAPQVRHFSAGHRVVAVDQRGHGASDAPHEDVTIETLADDLAWLCGEIGLERPLLVGHSMGCAVSLAAQARHPGLARGLALCDPAILFPERARPSLERMVEQLTLASWRKTVREFAGRAFFLDGDETPLRAEIVAGLLATPRRVLHSAFRSLLAYDAEPALRECGLPVLVLDAAIVIPDPERLQRARPDVAPQRFPDLGHFLQLEAPERINEALARFVAAC